ncbi:MAG: hypothetical protein II605_06110 [Paludibacteraceae bacterium]|nr:hypothetical protein [Paludibacteraceae bacterium]MBQ4018799.1 hypothetical protein [Paludibacteraceae bacterium]MBQ5378731.1 hypothetical protein [Paludibacteraceae bacterium]
MNEKYKLIPKFALLGLSLLSVIIIIGYLVMIFTGNSEGNWEVAGDILPIPKFSGAYLVWTYILAGLAGLTFACSLANLVMHLFQKNPKKAIMVIAIIITYVIVVPAICFLVANGDAVEIIGYEGTDNAGIWARISEAMLYWTYFAVLSTLCAMGWGFVHTSIKK